VELAYGQGKILHRPPREVFVNTPVLIEALVEDNVADVQTIKIFYRIAGQKSFIEDEMHEIMGVYKYNIPGKYATADGLEYLIIAEFTNGSMAAFPEVDPYNVPMFLSVKSRPLNTYTNGQKSSADLQGGLPNNAIILSPEDGEVVAAEEAVIAISLFNVPNVALNTVKVLLDEFDITANAQISEDLITVTPRNLLPGLHTVKVTFENQNQIPLNPLIWSFSSVRSIAEAERVFKYNTNIVAEASSEQLRGIRQDIKQVRATFNGNYAWLDFGANVFITDQESPYKQPRNRYTAQFSTNYLKIALGDINPQFADFGIRGKRVRGIEARMLLKYFNVHFIYGETERAITGSISSTPDTLSDGTIQYSRTGYTYKRNLFAVRPYFGSGKNFQFGLYFLKALDDTLSVDLGMNGIYPQTGQNIVFSGSSPQDNIVIGTDLTLALDNKRFVWQNEFALSYLNRNITGGALTKAALDTMAPGDTLIDGKISIEGGGSVDLGVLPIDPASISYIFIINKNIVPILPFNPDTGIVYALLNMPSSAFRTQLTLNYFNNYLIFKYQRVGPEYKSLGNPYMRTDVQGFSLSDRIRLFQNKLFVTLSFEQLRDNLLKQNKATTTTTSFNGSIALILGENLPTINLSTMQYNRKNDINTIDTTWLTTTSYKLTDNRESNMTVRQDIRIEHRIQFLNVKHTLSLSYANSERSDLLKSSRLSGYAFSSMTTSMVSMGVNSQFPFPLKTTLRWSSNHSESGLSSQSYDFISFTGQGEYGFFKDKLTAIAGYTLTNGKGLADFTQQNLFWGAQLTIFKYHQFRGYFSYSNLNDRTSNEVFNDFSFFLTYTMSL
jgi:hypothetical protein